MHDRLIKSVLILALLFVPMVSLSMAACPWSILSGAFYKTNCELEEFYVSEDIGLLAKDGTATIVPGSIELLDPNYGEIKIYEDGSFTFYPNPDIPNGVYFRFYYKANDGKCDSWKKLAMIQIVCKCRAVAPDVHVCTPTTIQEIKDKIMEGAGCYACYGAKATYDFSGIRPEVGEYTYTVTCPSCIKKVGRVIVEEGCEISWEPFEICSDEDLSANPGRIIEEGDVACVGCDAEPIIADIQRTGNQWTYSITCKSECGDAVANGYVTILPKCEVIEPIPLLQWCDLNSVPSDQDILDIVECNCDVDPVITVPPHWTGQTEVGPGGKIIHLGEYEIACISKGEDIDCSDYATGKFSDASCVCCEAYANPVEVCAGDQSYMDHIIENSGCTECVDIEPQIDISDDFDIDKPGKYTYTVTCHTDGCSDAVASSHLTVLPKCEVIEPIPLLQWCDLNSVPSDQDILDIVECNCDVDPIITVPPHWTGQTEVGPGGKIIHLGEYEVACISKGEDIDCSDYATGKFSDASCICCEAYANPVEICAGDQSYMDHIIENSGCTECVDIEPQIDISDDFDIDKPGKYTYTVTCHTDGCSDAVASSHLTVMPKCEVIEPIPLLQWCDLNSVPSDQDILDIVECNCDVDPVITVPPHWTGQTEVGPGGKIIHLGEYEVACISKGEDIDCSDYATGKFSDASCVCCEAYANPVEVCAGDQSYMDHIIENSGCTECVDIEPQIDISDDFDIDKPGKYTYTVTCHTDGCSDAVASSHLTVLPKCEVIEPIPLLQWCDLNSVPSDQDILDIVECNCDVDPVITVPPHWTGQTEVGPGGKIIHLGEYEIACISEGEDIDCSDYATGKFSDASCVCCEAYANPVEVCAGDQSYMDHIIENSGCTECVDIEPQIDISDDFDIDKPGKYTYTVTCHTDGCSDAVASSHLTVLPKCEVIEPIPLLQWCDLNSVPSDQDILDIVECNCDVDPVITVPPHWTGQTEVGPGGKIIHLGEYEVACISEGEDIDCSDYATGKFSDASCVCCEAYANPVEVCAGDQSYMDHIIENYGCTECVDIEPQIDISDDFDIDKPGKYTYTVTCHTDGCSDAVASSHLTVLPKCEVIEPIPLLQWCDLNSVPSDQDILDIVECNCDVDPVITVPPHWTGQTEVGPGGKIIHLGEYEVACISEGEDIDCSDYATGKFSDASCVCCKAYANPVEVCAGDQSYMDHIIENYGCTECVDIEPQIDISDDFDIDKPGKYTYTVTCHTDGCSDAVASSHLTVLPKCEVIEPIPLLQWCDLNSVPSDQDILDIVECNCDVDPVITVPPHWTGQTEVGPGGKIIHLGEYEVACISEGEDIDCSDYATGKFSDASCVCCKAYANPVEVCAGDQSYMDHIIENSGCENCLDIEPQIDISDDFDIDKPGKYTYTVTCHADGCSDAVASSHLTVLPKCEVIEPIPLLQWCDLNSVPSDQDILDIVECNCDVDPVITVPPHWTGQTGVGPGGKIIHLGEYEVACISEGEDIDCSDYATGKFSDASCVCCKAYANPVEVCAGDQDYMDYILENSGCENCLDIEPQIDISDDFDIDKPGKYAYTVTCQSDDPSCPDSVVSSTITVVDCHECEDCEAIADDLCLLGTMYDPVTFGEVKELSGCNAECTESYQFWKWDESANVWKNYIPGSGFGINKCYKYKVTCINPDIDCYGDEAVGSLYVHDECSSDDCSDCSELVHQS